ncbi:hypothetical protein [Streptococcus infantis]|uniref:Phage protein n=1 Tax=Streptococcus infantis TaxID=68892 RepID=A0A0F3HHZ2_9STRE|nr:hypothetical protein [Streptococcus infantis]KJU93687.1 hypothetical protein TZ96_00894 [Streptococcus infantis]MDU4338055.1 hypothetical protein [Streptococcus mitis]DAR96899.1 MAG TPA: Protein of unknown function (DUF1366) [Caudoviricetes sp.]
MAINGYNLSTKPYLRISGSNVETVVEIQLSEGNRYSTNSRSFPGDRTNESEDVLIQAVLDILKAELDPGSAIVKTQAQLEQANQKIAQNESEQNRLSALIKQTEENSKVNQKVIHVLVLNSVMSKNIEYGTTYKELVELIPLAEVGKTYLPHDLITIEDPEHVEVNGEGKRILVQLNKEFTYNGEPVSAFVTNGSLEQNGTGVAWKFEGKE